MSLDATKWQYRTDKSIRYIGGAHGAAGAINVVAQVRHYILRLQPHVRKTVVLASRLF